MRKSRLAAWRVRHQLIRIPADAKIRAPCMLWEKFHKPKTNRWPSGAAASTSAAQQRTDVRQTFLEDDARQGHGRRLRYVWPWRNVNCVVADSWKPSISLPAFPQPRLFATCRSTSTPPSCLRRGLNLRRTIAQERRPINGGDGKISESRSRLDMEALSIRWRQVS